MSADDRPPAGPRRDAADFPTFEDGDAEVRIVEAVLESHARQAWVAVDYGAAG